MAQFSNCGCREHWGPVYNIDETCADNYRIILIYTIRIDIRLYHYYTIG